MATTKIKVGDTVVIRKGSEKGATGKVTQISADKTRVMVDGINVRKIHKKPNAMGQNAGVYKEPRMISIANVGIAHPSKKNATGRIGFEVSKDGAKKRVFRANGKEVK